MPRGHGLSRRDRAGAVVTLAPRQQGRRMIEASRGALVGGVAWCAAGSAPNSSTADSAGTACREQQVKRHVGTILGKLGVQSCLQAVTRAGDLGLL